MSGTPERPRSDIRPGDQLWKLDDERFGGRCIIVQPEDTRESLIAAGMTNEGADEVMRFRRFLEDGGSKRYGCTFTEWSKRAQP